jgi:hypothetical protein
LGTGIGTEWSCAYRKSFCGRSPGLSGNYRPSFPQVRLGRSLPYKWEFSPLKQSPCQTPTRVCRAAMIMALSEGAGAV